jgi:CBS domain-containing protein
MRLSLPLGRFLGVDIRMHLSLLLLLPVAIAFSVALTGGGARGFALWLCLCLAIFIRELARAIAAAYAGLDLRALFLLPVGGIMAFSGDNVPTPRVLRWITYAGPIANATFGLLVAGLCYAFDPRISLWQQPWIGLGHILRSLVWTQYILGVVSMLPTPATTRVEPKAADPASPQRAGLAGFDRLRGITPAFSIGGLLAMLLMLAGFMMPEHYWLVILGAFMLLGAQLRSAQALAPGSSDDSILVRDVILNEYTLLSSSDTLQGALDRTAHSQQEVFPIVRGDQLVGSISRQTLASRLMSEGDGYLQGAMSRTLQMATPTESLVTALQRATALGAGELIAVVEGSAMVGILTPQSLNRAVHQVKLVRSRTGSDSRNGSN